MSDENEVVQQDAVETNAGTVVPGEQVAAPDTEARARAQGWVPKEEFRGPAEKWRDADEFVRRGEEELPILRERSRTLERKLAEVERENVSRYQRLEKMTEIALTRQRQELQSRYEAAMRQAVESGDVQRYDQLRNQQYEAVTDFDKRTRAQIEEPAAQPGAPPPHVQAAVQRWSAANTWFNSDPELNYAAQGVHVRLNREKPGLSIEENLAEVTKEMRRRFPDKFGTTEREPAVVEGSGGRMASGARRSPGASLSSEERRIGERFVKEGLFKNLDEYARELQNA